VTCELIRWAKRVHPLQEAIPVTVLQLQAGTIYGPINSRRLGRSLGINLLPSRFKLCSFDCVYCHYGRTKVKALCAREEQVPAVEQVVEAVANALQVHQNVDYITFSGNGEPTLHPHFPAIVSAVRGLRDSLRPGVELALLSNSTTVQQPRIQETLALFDAPIMKLDAGDPQTLAAINRPAPAVQLDEMVAGLRQIAGCVVQSVLVDGAVTNVHGEPYAAWLSALAQIGPAEVQIYSTDRPVADAGVERVDPERLRAIARDVREHTGFVVRPFWDGG
jgi:wyosine [tRNA(Phe)-imidazoG37] synthetase (radical SAM superfamily)